MEEYTNPNIDWNSVDFSGINLGDFGLGGLSQLGQFQTQPTAQPVQTAAYNEPVYSQPTPQPVQTATYTGTSAMPNDYASLLQSTAQRAYDQAALQSFGATGELSPRLDRIDTSTDFNYSPLAAQQFYNVNNYLSQPSDYNLSHSTIGALTDPRTGAPLPVTNTQAEQLATQPLANQFYANFQPESDNWASGNLQFDPTSQYRLIDRNTGNVLYSGTGYDAGQNISNLASGLMDQSGNAANWLVQTAPAGTNDWAQRYEHTPDADGFGTFLRLALPLALGPMGLAGAPGMAASLGMSGAMAGAAGSALGTGLAGAASGDSITDILKNAAIAGGLTYAGGSLFGPSSAPNVGDLQAAAIDTADMLSGLGINPTIAGQLAGVTSSGAAAFPTVIGNIGSTTGTLGGTAGTLAGTAGSLAGSGSNLIEVKGNRLPSSNLDSTLNIAAQYPGLINYGDQVYGDPNDIVVSHDPLTEPTYDPSAPVPYVDPSIPEGYGPDIIAEAPRETEVKAPPASLPDLFPPLNSVDIPPLAGTELPPIPPEDNEIVVEGQPPKVPAAPPLLPILPPPPLNSVNVPPADQFQPSGKSTLDKIIEYLRLAGLASGTLGNLFGGGGSGLSGARGALNPVFGAQLPASNLAARTQRPANFDWYRYGYGPEQSFFGNVPQGAPNTSTAYTGYAEGGYAVGGPGDGREDKIPAMLSDGEYVMDAETVALLGNGSNKAGAEMLDKFRVNVRKHKGKQLAKGSFSVDAKRPEQYLKGRK